MRTLAILSAAVVALSFSTGAMAQSQSAPQPGLPPGAAAGAPNAVQPRATGELSTTRVGPATAPAYSPAVTTAAPVHRTHRPRHHMRHHMHKTTAAPVAQ